MGGQWKGSTSEFSILDPLNGEPFIKVVDTQLAEIGPFVASLRSVPKSGLHNPLKNVERWERGHGRPALSTIMLW